jgi:hypothetical protein
MRPAPDLLARRGLTKSFGGTFCTTPRLTRETSKHRSIRTYKVETQVVTYSQRHRLSGLLLNRQDGLLLDRFLQGASWKSGAEVGPPTPPISPSQRLLSQASILLGEIVDMDDASPSGIRMDRRLLLTALNGSCSASSFDYVQR